MDKLTMKFNGKDVPQVWFTRKEVIALLEAEHQASRKQALEESSQLGYSDLVRLGYPNHAAALRTAIRSLAGNATKETTCAN